MEKSEHFFQQPNLLCMFQVFVYFIKHHGNFSHLACAMQCSVGSKSLRPHGLQPTRLLCLWNFPGKNTGVACHFLLQEIIPTQGLNLCLLHLRHWQDSLALSHLGSPHICLPLCRFLSIFKLVISLGNESSLQTQ